MIYIFLIFANCINVFTINRRWKRFLITRLVRGNNYKIKLHKKDDIYRNKNNFIIKNKEIISEKEKIMELLKTPNKHNA